MDQLVTRLVFFDSRCWKRMEGTAVDCMRLVLLICVGQSTVSLAKFVIGREKWRTFERNRLLLLRGPLGTSIACARVAVTRSDTLLFRDGHLVVSNADASVITGGPASFHSLQLLWRISQVCVMDGRSRAFLFA